jgi:mRNA interferase MazF
MAGNVNRGEVWMYAFRSAGKERPVVVLTRQEVVDLLRTVMVAPVTSTIRGAPSEVIVGIEEGLKHESAVNLDHVQTVAKSGLKKRRGRLGTRKMQEVCRALNIAAGCAP